MSAKYPTDRPRHVKVDPLSASCVVPDEIIGIVVLSFCGSSEPVAGADEVSSGEVVGFEDVSVGAAQTLATRAIQIRVAR